MLCVLPVYTGIPPLSWGFPRRNHALPLPGFPPTGTPGIVSPRPLLASSPRQWRVAYSFGYSPPEGGCWVLVLVGVAAPAVFYPSSGYVLEACSMSCRRAPCRPPPWRRCRGSRLVSRGCAVSGSRVFGSPLGVWVPCVRCVPLFVVVFVWFRLIPCRGVVIPCAGVVVRVSSPVRRGFVVVRFRLRGLDLQPGGGLGLIFALPPLVGVLCAWGSRFWVVPTGSGLRGLSRV